MRQFFREALTTALERSGLTKEELAYRVLPAFLFELIQRYLRVETTGEENIPAKGPCIVIANHSGFMGFDAMMLGYQVMRLGHRMPHVVAHKMWFIRPEISVHSEKLGLIPATFENALGILKKKQLLMLFPEGEEGNFKPTRFRYRLRPFRRGFVRLALKTGAPIIPAIVIGAEETHITLSQIRWAKELVGIIIPVPLNVLPLPVKWQIRFLKPIHLDRAPEKADDVAYVTKLSKQIRLELQRRIHEALNLRERVF